MESMVAVGTGSKQRLVFALNGERVELSGVDPSTTLLEFLRLQTPYKGAKLGCGEGGCGACVVLLSKYDAKSKQVEDLAISSCLTLLCSIDGCSVTTTEGLGNCRDGFHSIHGRFAGFHASQCGYCTPGMCMSLFSSLLNADKSHGPAPDPGFSKLTVSEAATAVVGNLCRCTGYRPIIDACKSFAQDVDMEDLGLNSFWKKGEVADVKKLPLYIPNKVCTFPYFLRNENKQMISISPNQPLMSTILSESKGSRTGQWFTPLSMVELLNVMEYAKEGRLVAGNTSSGIYKRMDYCDQYIDLTHVSELSEIKKDEYGIEFGAAVTISKVIDKLLEEEKVLGSERGLVFRKIAGHLSKVASKYVRNTASLGGNLIMAQRNGFASDIATILLGAGSSVKLQISSERLTLSLEEFLQKPPCSWNTILLSVCIPSCNPIEHITNGTINGIYPQESKLFFETYRAAPRPHGNAVAYLNAAFLLVASNDKLSGNVVVEHLQLAFGTCGSKHAVRATKLELFLLGKLLTPSVLLESMHLLREILAPDIGRSSFTYRLSLAAGFLFDFLHPLIKILDGPIRSMGHNVGCVDIESRLSCIDSDGNVHDSRNICQHELSSDLTNGITSGINSVHNHAEKLSVVSGRQIMDVKKDYYPIGLPTKKVGAEIQASGEALFVDDLPSPKDCLHGAFICSSKPLARVKKIELSTFSASKGSLALVSVKDIPKGGQNIGSQSIFGSEALFADVITEFVGQPLAVVVADRQKDACIAAENAMVCYDTENLEPPILSVEEAISRSSFFQPPAFFSPEHIGDFSKGMSEADHKIHSAEVEIGSQYYFYMETQTALAVPDEDNCMVVYSSTQVPETCQVVIAKCLGVPEHNVRVISRRVGGGFGGKAFRSVPVATACALAAHRLRRPVRMYLDRKADMMTVMGRHPMKVKYSVGFKDDGAVTALHVDVLIDAGISADVSPAFPLFIVETLKKYNWQALSFDIKVCKTNLLTKSAMRGRGNVQGSIIAETVIEHVASFLCMEPYDVRNKNLHTFETLKLFYRNSCGEPAEYTLPVVLDKLITSSCFHSRAETVRQFNRSNRWRKRGLSIVPTVHEVTVRPTPGKVSILNDGSVVVEVGGIELGQGLWTKVKQMAAFALGKLLNGTSKYLLERVRVVQADTLSLAQGGYTAGSTTSESSCEAVRLACNILVERLTPVMVKLQESMDIVSWDALILQAHLQSVNLSASTYWVPSPDSFQYLNFGAAASEVEVDLLTGATTILRTDITYDCGLSLNPAVDLGQIEGAFVQGVGFFMLEKHVTNSDGLVLSDGTWTYKIPTIDTIPRQFNVEVFSSGYHKNRVLSSKASGEPPLLLAASVHCAARQAIKEARKDLRAYNTSEVPPAIFRMDIPATMDVIKELCGLDNVESYLHNMVTQS
ncbi:indole-3-acetaldehyde oxidase-like isoform X1 [Nymphaea colorata]|nr:indole-3-acetaldehyde oxidase-like isoform X1 [Nymphaea colorata]